MTIGFCECATEDSSAGNKDLGYYAMRLNVGLATGDEAKTVSSLASSTESVYSP